MKNIWHLLKFKNDTDSIDYAKADACIRKFNVNKQHKLNKIAILVFDVATLKRFDSILQHLENDCFDIVYNSNNAKQILRFAAQRRYNCRSLYSVLVSNEIYALTLSHLMWFAWHLSKFLPNVIAERHIRLIYSLGFKDEVLSHSHNYIYDKVLCYGPYQKRILESNSNAEIVEIGNPRLDQYFWETFDKESAKKNYKIDARKQTVVWMTTISDASSIREFINIMIKISKNYNVLINPHPLTVKKDMDLINASPLREKIVIGDNLTLFSVADFVVCDYGGALFSAIYLDKNLILLDPSCAKQCGILTEDSPEFYVRKYIKGYSSLQEEEIITALRTEKNWKEQKKIRQTLSNEFFLSNKGSSAYSAARILKKELKNAF